MRAFPSGGVQHPAEALEGKPRLGATMAALDRTGDEPAPVAVSIGGSFLVQDAGIDVSFAREVAGLLSRVATGRRVLAVVGGGAVARRYIEAARALGEEESTLDDLGIAITRANARVLLAALPSAFPRPPATLDEAAACLRTHRIVVMGGTHPGHTTDAVAAMAAEKSGAFRLVIATNVDGVYEADPRKNPRAKRLPRLSAEELVRITFEGFGPAGSTGVVDPLGARIIARSGIPCAIVNGRDLKALEAALEGRDDFHGSFIPGRSAKQKGE
jgi:uridylate kinase